LEREYDRQLAASFRAAVEGRNADAARYSAAALVASRALFDESTDLARHRPALAAALYNHAGSLHRIGRDGEALALLEESGQHYDALAQVDPLAFQVKAIDVMVRTGLTLQATGDLAGAERRFRDAIEAYQNAASNDTLERDLGLARTQFHLGRCLLTMGPGATDGLAAIDAGLFTAERVRQQQGIPEVPDRAWLAMAPRSFLSFAPTWIAAAACAMELHHGAGRFDIAADAANIAVRVSAGLAGGPGARRSTTLCWTGPKPSGSTRPTRCALPPRWPRQARNCLSGAAGSSSPRRTSMRSCRRPGGTRSSAARRDAGRRLSAWPTRTLASRTAEKLHDD
jgi:tetratricopeptide (TPR) repeat protein